MVRILYINITVFLDQINAALVRIRDFQKHLNTIIKSSLWTVVYRVRDLLNHYPKYEQ